jgi:hypothetical protein
MSSEIERLQEEVRKLREEMERQNDYCPNSPFKSKTHGSDYEFDSKGREIGSTCPYCGKFTPNPLYKR